MTRKRQRIFNAEKRDLEIGTRILNGICSLETIKSSSIVRLRSHEDWIADDVITVNEGKV